LIFCLMFSPVLCVSSTSFKFSKAAKPLEILIWYYFLTHISFRFLTLHLSRSELCAAFLLTSNLSLTAATTR
jgi:hypothetical protein